MPLSTAISGALAAAVVALAAGCGSSVGHHVAAAHPNYAPTHTVAPADTPLGSGMGAATKSQCSQMLIVIGKVRGELEGAPTDATMTLANNQLEAPGKSVGDPLAVMVFTVGTLPGEYQLDTDMDRSGNAAVKAFAGELNDITHRCEGQ
jgi:hypothetical protein